MTQFPDQEFTVICLSNCDEIVPWAINRRIADIALGDRLEPLPSRTTSRPASELPTVELQEADLRDKTGAYRMKKTGFIWRITLQDGDAPVDGPPHGDLSSPALERHAFRSRESAGSFPPPSSSSRGPRPDRRGLSTSRWDRAGQPGQDSNSRRSNSVDPTPDQLQEYAGRYESDELAATYRLTVRDGRLWLRVNSRRWEPLDATVRDEFVPSCRNPPTDASSPSCAIENGQVSGLSVEYYRVKGVRFAKR